MGCLQDRLQDLRRFRGSQVAIRIRASSYPVDVALELEREVGLGRPIAVSLARRGIADASEAKDFLDPTGSVPAVFGGMETAASEVVEAIRADRKITIYGDFDCDGVCATSVLVGGIRRLGGNCDWFIPDRISDGYGLNAEAIKEIAARGTEMVITVDCGVTAVEEVKLAQELGMVILITDHHQPGPELPDCAILHPAINGYPFPELCGTAVAARLASYLRRDAGDPSAAAHDEADLDLVALATVADVMPLVGENRQLVREGVRVARRARRVGLAALMAEAKTDPQGLTSEDMGFRLAPRINAAGRIYRADAGVELFLAESKERAAEIATELSKANMDRRRIEREVESAAKAELKEQGDLGSAVVVAGEGWHPGVVGIVASKLVKATGRPSVVIALDGETGRGSARSVPGLDLHSAIGEASGFLEGFGGHAAAAGLSIKPELVGQFREAFCAEVGSRIGNDPPDPEVGFDAVASGAEISLDMAEQIERLEPFGKDNPAVRLMVPGALIEDLQEMGEGKHCRFTVRSGGYRAKGVAFGRNNFGLEPGQAVDLIAELGINHWNGSIESRLQVLEAVPVEPAQSLAECGEVEWWERFEEVINHPIDVSPTAEFGELQLVDAPAGLPGVVLSELISSGERICVVVADSRQRWRALGGESLARFSPAAAAGDEDRWALGLWAGSPKQDLLEAERAGLLLVDFPSLGQLGDMSLGRFDRIVLIDPPFTAQAVNWLADSAAPVHLLGGSEEFEFSAQVASHRLDLTAQLRELYRGLRDCESAEESALIEGEALRRVLSTDGEVSRAPEEAAYLLRILEEAGLARTEGSAAARRAGVVSSKKTDLSVSAVFVHHLELHKEQERFLIQLNRQIQKPS